LAPTNLDHVDTIRLLPDITWWQDGRCRAVIDAKYKRVTNDAFPNADAYQMLAYCTRLGLPTGYLIYADLDGGKPGTSIVRNAGIEIVATWVDISGSIEELQASIDKLAKQLTLPTRG
jgi:5-methylcytosine-specific restriction enzyme subunit McrC